MTQKRILVIDDEKDIGEAIAAHFVEEGSFVVDVATNGREGLEKIHAAKPDIIILDIFMPVMDGMTFLSALRDGEGERSECAVPVILMTGCYMENLMKELPISAIAVKPIYFDDLLKKVNRILEDVHTS